MYQWYIKLYRSSQDNVLYFSEPFTKWQAWQDMILIANHKDGVIIVRGNIVEVKRGQLWYAEDTLAVRRGRSRNKVRRFLNYLETIQQIEQLKSKVKSVVSIKNYNKYQSNDTTESTTDGHQTIQQTDTNKNDNNDKEWKEEIKNGANAPTGKPDKSRKDITDLINKIKMVCKDQSLVYDKTREREFCKHILDTVDYWEFCEAVKQSRVAIALKVVIASVQNDFWRGYASWPMQIYQWYSEILNDHKKRKGKVIDVSKYLSPTDKQWNTTK